MHLGELTWPDKRNLQDYHKVITCNTVVLNSKLYQFFLPSHKADQFFKGNIVLIQATQTNDNP